MQQQGWLVATLASEGSAAGLDDVIKLPRAENLCQLDFVADTNIEEVPFETTGVLKFSLNTNWKKQPTEVMKLFTNWVLMKTCSVYYKRGDVKNC